MDELSKYRSNATKETPVGGGKAWLSQQRVETSKTSSESVIPPGFPVLRPKLLLRRIRLHLLAAPELSS